jgi:hypothetical protein
MLMSKNKTKKKAPNALTPKNDARKVTNVIRVNGAGAFTTIRSHPKHGRVAPLGKIQSVPKRDPLLPKRDSLAESVELASARVTVTASALLNSRAAGMWEKRTDIPDSAQYARDLRTKAQSRSDTTS